MDASCIANSNFHKHVNAIEGCTMPKFTILGCLIFVALLLFFYRDTPLGVADFPNRDCVAFRSWLNSKTQKFKPEIEHILPPPDPFLSTADSNLEWSAVAKNILSWAGWPSSRMKFASFRQHTYTQLINSPNLQIGAFLIVIPGPQDVKLSRRKNDESWVTASPRSFADALPLKTLEILAAALESRQAGVSSDHLNSNTGHNNSSSSTTSTSTRKLQRFHIEIAPTPSSFPLCRGRGGACAIWEGSTGRVILDADVARRIRSSPTIAKLIDQFTLQFAGIINNGVVDSGTESGKERKLSGNVDSKEFQDSTGVDEETLSSSLVNASFFSTMAQYMKGHSKEDYDHNKHEEEQNEGYYSSSAGSIGAFIAKAATAAITSLLLSGGGGGSSSNSLGRQPLWWCLTCPIVLGLLAPFVINFGLTAAAEQLCAALQLPADECSELWWGAFAVAMVLSLGSAVPIVYVCRLPDCVKHALE